MVIISWIVVEHHKALMLLFNVKNFACEAVVFTLSFCLYCREELEKQKAHERHMKLQEQGKTEQARKDLERLSLIYQQRAEAAKKREEEG
ncbi:hypothetical protein I3760_09G064900 [Carya illinoinensis]|nr:hypothetical protein I3760_09G064900 [Carya illinoinensis]